MPAEIDNPLENYRNHFREGFLHAAEEEFQRLLKASGVDEAENARRVAAIRKLEGQLSSAESKKGLLTMLMILLFLGLAAAGICCYHGFEIQNQDYQLYGGGAAAAILLLLITWVIPARSRASTQVSDLKQKLEEEKNAAYEQMAPLNALYDWDITSRLIHKVCPILNLDPYFTEGRLAELEDHFGWNRAYHTDQRSVLFSQSGDIQGNPFAFGEVLAQEWGKKTYSGSIVIHWRERCTDSKGKSYWVTRSETLVATVTKPIPVYGLEKFLIYGNDAAPDLSFSREPSSLSKAGNGWWDRHRMKREYKKLKKYSENLDDDSQYTLMSNQDFEVLFHAMNRDHEVQFRLLYTPLAMQQTVSLLKDQEVGYGDDFKFIKDHRMNTILPEHLRNFDLTTDPAIYRNYNLEDARRFFLTHNAEYFKQVYFSLAPLLCVPLYQQMRTAKTIYGYTPGEESSFWEHESLANYLGEERFRHPSSITRNILKTEKFSRNGQSSSVIVTAHGFRGEKHVEYITKWGGDGHTHEVPVEWIEYLPVEQVTQFELSEQIPVPMEAEDGPQTARDRLQNLLGHFGGMTPLHAAYRRSVFAWMK